MKRDECNEKKNIKERKKGKAEDTEAALSFRGNLAITTKLR